MRIQVLGRLDTINAVACSGGVDSMAILDFLRRARRPITAVYFNHGTEHGKEAQVFVAEHCAKHNIPLLIGKVERDRAKGESLEQYWRNERYRFLESLDMNITTAHHLNDLVETWLFTSFHGKTKFIPYRRGNVVRPFLLTPKAALEDWCKYKGIDFIQDPSNFDVHHARNRIRHRILPEVQHINPGILKRVASLYRKSEIMKDTTCKM